jgi:hypothetical protein
LHGRYRVQLADGAVVDVAEAGVTLPRAPEDVAKFLLTSENKPCTRIAWSTSSGGTPNGSPEGGPAIVDPAARSELPGNRGAGGPIGVETHLQGARAGHLPPLSDIDAEADMGRFSGEKRSVAAGAAAHDKVPAPGAKEISPASALDRLTLVQRRDLATLRRKAMELTAGLGRLAKGKPNQTDDRLLAKSDGVIDGFNILTQIVTRIVDKERQSFGPAEISSHSAAEGVLPDEQSIDHRITDELDRVAARGGTPEGAGPDRAGS